MTVTGDTGPAVQNTSIILTNLEDMHIDFVKRILSVRQITSQGPQYKEYDLIGTTTLTFTISGSGTTYVITLSVT